MWLSSIIKIFFTIDVKISIAQRNLIKALMDRTDTVFLLIVYCILYCLFVIVFNYLLSTIRNRLKRKRLYWLDCYWTKCILSSCRFKMSITSNFTVSVIYFQFSILFYLLFFIFYPQAWILFSQSIFYFHTYSRLICTSQIFCVVLLVFITIIVYFLVAIGNKSTLFEILY